MNDEPVPHPHRMALWGAPAEARFPPLCPNCGSAASRSLPLAKSFVRSTASDTPNETVVLSVAVPFCDACIARHDASSTPPGPLSTLLTGFASAEMFGAAGFAAAAAFTTFQALRELSRGRASHFLVFAALALAFGAIAAYLGRKAWHDTEHARVRPQTEVSRAFDYGDNQPAPFRAPMYTCTMRDDRFFAAFQALNRDIEFLPGSAEETADRQQANRQTWIVGIVVAAIAAFFLLRDQLR
jgi:hypothetical protein